MMSIFLDFPYIVQEPAAHLFGVPHGHEHSASEPKCESRLMLGADPAHLPKQHTRPPSVCLQGIARAPEVSPFNGTTKALLQSEPSGLGPVVTVDEKPKSVQIASIKDIYFNLTRAFSAALHTQSKYTKDSTLQAQDTPLCNYESKIIKRAQPN